MMLWKCCTQYASKFGKLSSNHRTRKGEFSFQSLKKGNAKERWNYSTIALISHTSNVMLKILQEGFNGTWTVNFQMFKLVLEKAEEPEIKLPTSSGSSKKQESSRKTSTFVDYTKAFDRVDHNKLRKILKEMGIPDHLTCLLKSVCRSRSNS